MISRQTIKQNAKNMLGNKLFGSIWLMAVLVLFLESAILAAASSFGFGIITLLITGPLSVGVISVFVNLARGSGSINIEDMFSGFKNGFGRNFLVALMSGIFVFLWSLLFVIPGIIKTYSYSMAYYIANDHPEYDWNTCIKESKRLTNGHKMDLFILDLSFIGWYFVGALCLGIGALWVAPYHSAARVGYYEAIVASQNQQF